MPPVVKAPVSPKKATDKPKGIKLEGAPNGGTSDREPKQSARKGGKETPKDTPRKGKGDTKAKTGKASTKKSERPLEAINEETRQTAEGAAEKEKPTTVYIGDKKIEYFTKELLSRQPLDEKSNTALYKKAGPPKQECSFERNENHRPIGRQDGLTPSRHERVPPSMIVLMFNCFEASFSLEAGDISTLPESDTLDLRSLTSGKVLGRIKITPEKGASRVGGYVEGSVRVKIT